MSPPSLHGPLTLTAAAAIFLAIQVVSIALGMPAVLGPDWILAGPDTYMWLARTEHLLASGAWYDPVMPLAGAPHGEALHWSRLFDLLLIGGAAPLAAFVGWHQALLIWGTAISPVLAIASLWVLSWIVRPWANGAWYLLAALLFSLMPALKSYFLVARPDHHSLQLLLLTIGIALVLRLLDGRGDRASARLLGVTLGIGFWVSVEGLLPYAVVAATLGLTWVIRGGAQSRQMARTFAWTAIIALLALAIERPPGDWLTVVEYDRLSLPHVLLLVILAAAWMVIATTTEARRLPLRPQDRLAYGLASVAVAALAMAALYPDFFHGPFAAMDPRLKELWLSRISEVKPLLAFDAASIGKLIFFLGPTLLALGYMIAPKGETPDSPINRQRPYFWVALPLFLLLACYQVRWATYAELAAVPIWARMLERAMTWTGAWVRKDGTRVPLRALLFLLIMLGHFALGAGFLLASGKAAENVAQKDTNDCRWAPVADYLKDPAVTQGRLLTLFAFTHQGPELLYRSGHRVVGTPYQRNADSILDSEAAWTDDTADLGTARRILSQRKVDFVVFCPASKEAKLAIGKHPDSLAARLADGRAPDWLTAQPMPEAIQGFLLFKRAD